MKKNLYEMIAEKDGIESVFTVGDLIEELSQYPKDDPVKAVIFKKNSLTGGCLASGLLTSISTDHMHEVYLEAYTTR